jgi:hypothetical protein
MAHHRHRAGTPLGITRSFERSRLADHLVAAAYELTVPLVRRSLSSPSYADRPDMAGGEGDEGLGPRSAAGGFTA